MDKWILNTLQILRFSEAVHHLYILQKKKKKKKRKHAECCRQARQIWEHGHSRRAGTIVDPALGRNIFSQQALEKKSCDSFISLAATTFLNWRHVLLLTQII